MATADSVGANVIIANDPDADRLAAAERLPSGEWKIFNGNELGIILADWAYTQYKAKHPNVDNSAYYHIFDWNDSDLTFKRLPRCVEHHCLVKDVVGHG